MRRLRIAHSFTRRSHPLPWSSRANTTAPTQERGWGPGGGDAEKECMSTGAVLRAARRRRSISNRVMGSIEEGREKKASIITSVFAVSRESLAAKGGLLCCLRAAAALGQESATLTDKKFNFFKKNSLRPAAVPALYCSCLLLQPLHPPASLRTIHYRPSRYLWALSSLSRWLLSAYPSGR
jgi:hypothetical protein